MIKRLPYIFSLVLLVAAGWGVTRLFQPVGSAPAQAKLASVIPENPQGYERATGPRNFQFPQDYGPHPNFQTEWWYYTGNLNTASGRHFGYQLTFFRRALLPVQSVAKRSSDWATNQVYLAHFALTDVADGRFQSFEKLERGAAGLAGAQGTPSFKVWLEDWSVEQTGPTAYRLQASQNGLSIDFELTDLTGPVLQGDHGYSQKGPEPGNASYYFSQPRLATQGTIQVNNQNFSVTGLSWMDHEFSTSALSQGEVGWDWFGLQLSDGSELMVYDIRRSDGSIDPYSSGTWILPDASTHSLKQTDFTLQVEGTWHSPHSGATYPAKWKVSVPSLGISLKVTPYLADQENNLSFVYWEGAVQIVGTVGGVPVTGSGYVELTGYAGSIAGEF
ncbi:MAG: hypothetical protein M1281_10695 [Chloroflexi bacterium]|nr:hypothetical protein [Chloroflexota bacterium]